MKTDQLVSALVADRAVTRSPLRRVLVFGTFAGALGSLGIFAVEFGPRVDLASALATWRFDVKLALVALALAAAFAACLSMARPLPSHRWKTFAFVALATAATAAAVELLALPRDEWTKRLVGTNALVCLTAIPLFALAPLFALLVVLRRAAPRSPALAGAAGGALAWAVASAIYAFHCFDDSPLFVLVWYPMAAIPVVATGYIVGSRLLRW